MVTEADFAVAAVTLSPAEALRPFPASVPVMFTVPAETAVTRPLEASTVATEGLSEDQDTGPTGELLGQIREW